MPSRVLVTGGAGFIGLNLVAHLAERGYSVTILDIAPRPPLPRGITYRQGDIRDPRAVGQAMAEVDAVVHLAAATRVIDSIDDPGTNFDVNVRGTLVVLDAARTAGIRQVIAASTGGAILGEAPVPVTEAMAPAPMAPYGASKLAMEGYLSAYAGAYGLHAAALRFSNIYGPGSRHKGSVIAKLFNALLADKTFTLYGDGSQVRDYLYVGDLVAGIRQAMEVGVTGTYQLGSGVPTRLSELLKDVHYITGYQEIPLAYAPFRAGEVHTTYCSITKAVNAFGFAPTTSLRDGLAATWAWFCNNAGMFRRSKAAG